MRFIAAVALAIANYLSAPTIPPKPNLILLLPPGFSDPQQVIDDVLKRHKLTNAVEIESKAGCRRFRLS